MGNLDLEPDNARHEKQGINVRYIETQNKRHGRGCDVFSIDKNQKIMMSINLIFWSIQQSYKI